MPITDTLVLAEDVTLVEVESLPAETRKRIKAAPGDRVVTRPRVRSTSKLVDPDAAALLEHFRAPSTIVAAVLAFSRARGLDPGKTLDDAYPMIRRLVDGRILVSTAEGSAAGRISPSFEPGDEVDGATVTAQVSLIDDTEVYQVRGAGGAFGALKIARAGHAGTLRPLLANEARAYRALDGEVTPRLLADGEIDGRGYLLTSWCAGGRADAVAAEARSAGDRGALLALCRAIAGAYAHLHAQGIVHGDVHPGNVLVRGDGGVTLVDFGYARPARERGPGPKRGGVAFYFEPEYARAFLAGRSAPRATRLGEQYAVAALLYTLVTGAEYLDFSLQERETMRQIAEDAPLSLAAQGAPPWPALEAVLDRALQKSPRRRFPSLRRFAAELGAIGAPERDPAPRSRGADGPLARLLARFQERVSPGGERYAAGMVEPPRASVSLGAAGIAYALYRIALAREQADVLALADVWMARAWRAAAGEGAFYAPEKELTAELVGAASAWHTAPGLSCVQALVSLAMNDRGSAASAASALADAARDPGPKLDVGFGRSGLLLALAAVHEACPELALTARGDEVLSGLWSAVDRLGPVGRSPEVPVLGIAHGWAGFLYATLRWCAATGAALPTAAPARLAELAALGEPWGRGQRFRRELAPGSSTGYWSGWCNGSAGMVHLFVAAHAALHEAPWLDRAEASAWATWQDEDRQGTLCCGLGGRAYALLALYQATGAPVWVDRARTLAEEAALRIGKVESYRDSLYNGEAGIAVLAAEIDHPDLAAMPLFAGEGWPPRAA
jgi:serine/threonine protein kinase